MRDILVISADGAKKTHILYRTNLSHSQLQGYLSFLVRAGAMEIIERGSTKIYRTTPKGKKIVEQIDELIEHLTEKNRQQMYKKTF